jgi:hypothetical protein
MVYSPLSPRVNGIAICGVNYFRIDVQHDKFTPIFTSKFAFLNVAILKGWWFFS